MIKNPLVTIIIPAYNTEKYIDKCLRSVLEQSYKEIEVIMLDDGSKDKTNEICQKYEKIDKRFKLISKKNTGVSDTRNIGIYSAGGKYLIFIDSDDYIAPDYVEILVRKAESENVQMVCAEYFWVNEKQVIKHATSLSKDQELLLSAKDAVNMLHKDNAFQGYLWNKIFIRKIIIEENILFDSEVKIWEDMLFCLKYLTRIERIIYINKPLYYYVQRINSAMNDNAVWNENTQLLALKEMWKIICADNGEFHNYIRDYYANDLAGKLGKDGFRNEQIIKEMLEKIENLKGELSLKHKIKVDIFKYSRVLFGMLKK